MKYVIVPIVVLLWAAVVLMVLMAIFQPSLDSLLEKAIPLVLLATLVWLPIGIVIGALREKSE